MKNPVASFTIIALGLLAFFNISHAKFYEGETQKIIIKKDNKISKFNFSLSAPIYKVSYSPRLTVKHTREWVCEESCPADGSQGDWKGFYRVSISKKPHRLARAIKGMGVKTAAKAVRENYFYYRPRSWQEFKEEIRKIDDTIQAGIYYNVINKYGEINRRGLGYYSNRERGYWRTEPKLVLEKVKISKYHKTVTKKFQVIFENSDLLASELEKHIFYFDGINYSYKIDQSKNSYTIVNKEETGNIVKLTFMSVKRQKTSIKLSDYMVTLKKKDNKSLTIAIRDLNFSKSNNESPVSHTVVELALFRTRNWWPDDNVVDYKKYTLFLDPKSDITFLTDKVEDGLLAGYKYWVKYRIKKVDSKYFNDGFSSWKESSEFLY